MHNLTVQVSNHLAMIYLISNTPAFLYNRYLAERSIQSLAHNTTAHELVSTATRIAAKNDRTPTELAVGYSALVALTLKGIQEAMAALHGANLSGLEWSDKIIELWKKSAVSSSRIFAVIKPKVDSLATFPMSPILTAGNIVTVKVEPKIYLGIPATAAVTLAQVVFADSKG